MVWTEGVPLYLSECTIVHAPSACIFPLCESCACSSQVRLTQLRDWSSTCRRHCDNHYIPNLEQILNVRHALDAPTLSMLVVGWLCWLGRSVVGGPQRPARLCDFLQRPKRDLNHVS